MPVELRKRKAHQIATEKPTVAKKTSSKEKVAKAAEKVKEAIVAAAAKTDTTAAKPTVKVQEEKSKKQPPPADATAAGKSGQVAVGETVDLDTFGGEIETNEGVKTTLKKLVDDSKSGVVLFTYPKASTPGCTKQACLFRDAYTPLTATGLSIYGLSSDTPKANTIFKTKQNLPYPLLCDPSATLIKAIGLQKTPKGTQRGVFVIDKQGKVLAAEGGGPDGTFKRAEEIAKSMQ